MDGLQFVRTLQGALRHLILYAPKHAQVQPVIRRALDSLTKVLKGNGPLSVSFRFNSVVLNNVVITEPSLSWMAGELGKRRAASLTFQEGISETELRDALNLLATTPEKMEREGGLASLLRAHPLEHVRIIPVEEAAAGPRAAAKAAGIPQWLARGLEQAKPGSAEEIFGSEEMGGTPQAHLAHAAQKADMLMLCQIIRGALKEMGPASAEVLPAALLEAMVAAAERGELSQAERLLRAQAGLGQRAEKLAAMVPEKAPEEVRKELEDYVAWLCRPIDKRLSAFAEWAGPREYDWVLLEIEHELVEGQTQDAGSWLLNLILSGGPAREAERADILTRGQGLLDRICSAGLPANLGQLINAVTARLQVEHSPLTAAPLLESLAVLTETAAEHQEFALATVAADTVAQFARESSAKGEIALQVQTRLLNPQTMSQLLDTWITQEKDPTVNRNILPLLKKAGDQTARELLALLEKESVAGRRLRLLNRLKILGKSASRALSEAISHPQWFVVRNAVLVMGELADPALLEDLAPALSHPDVRVQQAAVSAALKIRSPARALPLAQALGSMNPAVLETVLDDLLVLKDPGTVPHVDQFVRQARKDIRFSTIEKALFVMGAIEKKESIDALVGLAGETGLSRPYRQTALRALSKMQIPGAELAMKYFIRTCPDPSLTEEAKKLLPVWDYL